MKIHLIAVGQRMPDWVEAGYGEFAKRLSSSECPLQLVELAPGKRGKGMDLARAMRDEGKRMLEAIPKGALVIALDQRGREWDTQELSVQLDDWLGQGRDVALLVGGPEGLDAECLALAERKWSLSRLTLPHPMVRVLLAEQLYRAWSILKNHPYHR
ncbi:MAG: 23S rRNA (pseudouridine(1915)-N(3))-methyltransferase RlmH [Gammaproteobacteria bacterium]|nr:23S rRNA (pseudouridine(1915)-N(3))-methyltransferase RlmH [Gammaproteobacteria bacterium]